MSFVPWRMWKLEIYHSTPSIQPEISHCHLNVDQIIRSLLQQTVCCSTMGIYTSLDSSERQIRLLSVLLNEVAPGSEQSSSLVCCDLSIHSLNHDTPPSYTALSYVWGPPSTMSGSGDDTLVVNGETIPARENLLSALRSFQRRKDTAFLWVDAVCINQDDLEEKMTQIKLMGDIYSLAERTVIWLGPAENDSDVAMDLVRDLKEKDVESPRFEEKRGSWKAIRLLLQRSWCK